MPALTSVSPASQKIVHVVGARPNFMKTAPLVHEMNARGGALRQVLIHTGQHYDDNMSDIFFRSLGLRAPDVDLGVGSGSHAEQAARVMMAIEPVLIEHEPDWVVVVGDVNSTLASALTAAKLGMRVAHVEAGLRSFDRTMPEEHNRVLTDHVADLLLTPSRDAGANLRNEGIPEERVRFVGNVMIDSLVRLLPQAVESWPRLRAELNLSDGQPYALVTLHRPANVDGPDTLSGILDALIEISRRMPVIFPVHPRTRQSVRTPETDGRVKLPSGLRLMQPQGYLEFLAMERHAAVVITDSGGIQEETTYLGVPCVTVRPNTERPMTVTHGTNRLVAADPQAIVAGVDDALGRDRRPAGPPELWDGRAAGRIVDALLGVEAGLAAQMAT